MGRESLLLNSRMSSDLSRRCVIRIESGAASGTKPRISSDMHAHGTILKRNHNHDIKLLRNRTKL